MARSIIGLPSWPRFGLLGQVNIGRSGGGATGDTRATAPAPATGRPVARGIPTPVGVVPADGMAAPGVHATGVTAPDTTGPLVVSPDAAVK